MPEDRLRVRERAADAGVNGEHRVGLESAHDEHADGLLGHDDGLEPVVAVHERAGAVELDGLAVQVPLAREHVAGVALHRALLGVAVPGRFAEILLRELRRHVFLFDIRPVGR